MAKDDGWETIKPAAPSVKESGGGGWETIAPPKEPTTTAAGTFARSAAEAAAATPAALYGAKIGFAVTPPVLPFVGPAAKPIGGIVGGLVGGALGMKGIDAIEQMVDNVFGTSIRETKAAQQQEHPTAALAGQVAGGAVNPWMKIGMAGSVKQAATGAAIMTGVGAGMRAVEGGDPFDPKAVAADVFAGAFTKPTARGEKLLGHTTSTPSSAHTADTEKPAPSRVTGASIEEQQAYLDKLKATKKTKDDSAKLTQAAIKNKDTGEIELHGPKHDEERKTATKDTHEQGFVDENGNFLNRKDAWNRAKNTGQVLEGQLPERPKEGLHSGDLRKAGNQQFRLLDIPESVEGIAVTKNLDKKRADGTMVGATTLRDESGKAIGVGVNEEHLFAQFKDKPWTKPKVEGVDPLPEDAFKTPQEYADFVIQHEAEHIKYPHEKTLKGEKLTPEERAHYENLTNQRALKTLADKKAAKGEAPTPKAPVAEEPPVDRTKTDPRDVASKDEFYDIAQEIYEKHGEVEAIKFYEGFKEYEKTWMEPLKETEKFVGINLKNKLANERNIHNEKARIEQELPDPASRERVAVAVDKGDLSGLSPAEKKVAERYSEMMKDIGDRAAEKGVIKGLLEDYVSHIINWEGAPPTARQEFIQALLGTTKRDPTMRGAAVESKFGKRRQFRTFADLEAFLAEANARIEASGKSDFRLKLKTKDLAEIYKTYAMSMEKAIENKTLVDNLKQIRNPAGEAWVREVTPDKPKPDGFVTLDSPQFSGYAVHEDMVPALKFVFDAGPGKLMEALGNISQVTKRLNVVGSFFHAKSLMEVLSSTGIPVWTPVKEVTLGGVDKLLGTKYSGLTKAVDQYRKGGLGDNVDRWIKDGGLQLEVPEDVSKGVLTATGKFADSMIGKYGPKTRILEKTLSTAEKYTLGYFDKFTWDFLHTGGKLMVADKFLEKARIDAAKSGKPFDEAASRKEISRFVNDSFGGLNWFDAATQTQNEFAKRMAMAAYSPEGRRGLQVALFAPDWTISTLRAFTSALPKELNPAKWHPVEGVKGMMTPTTKADYARLYQFKTALTYFTLLNAINMMTAGRPIWENKDKSRIEFPDGTSMQAMKHAMEPYHWLTNPDQTLANKLGFIPKAAVVGLGGLEYAGPNAEKLVDRSATGRLKAVAETVLPFQVQAAATAPEGEGAKRALLGTMGFPVYGMTAKQRKEKRAEREKALKQKAKEYWEEERKKGRGKKE